MRKTQGIKVLIDYPKRSERNASTYEFNTIELDEIEDLGEPTEGIPSEPKLGVFFEWTGSTTKNHVLRAQITAPHIDDVDPINSENRTLTVEIGLDRFLGLLSKALRDGKLRIEPEQLSDLLISLGQSLQNSKRGTP
ncbi:hypothetical protein [Tabrizicola sp.]|uniref:hypothetical protein n=1 Tax=Tabrizicola sp. TaxID=2005166 RepID=UPI001A479CA4|nr:hypothetical protein [Tabrizicola sp.]MBL9061439.1 hypothetical protein [Tabrizicola sp.]